MKVVGGIAGLFWPRRCLACGDECRTPVCAHCTLGVGVRAGPRCRVCDVALPVAGPARRCGSCLRRTPAFHIAHGVFEYDGVVGEAVRAGKYGRSPGALRWVAGRLAQHIPEVVLENPPDYVVPVPLHWRRVDERGCAPPLILAAAVARRLGVPCTRRLVARNRNTPEQVGLDANARRRNLRDAFAVRRPATGHALIVDDVMTTGATLDALARVLLRDGATRVDGLAALRVD